MGGPVVLRGHRGGFQPAVRAVIEAINERFGADLDDRDRLEVEKIKRTLLDRDDLRTFAQANTEEHYALEFGHVFKGAVLDQEGAQPSAVRAASQPARARPNDRNRVDARDLS